MVARLAWIPLLIVATNATAMPPELTPSQFLDICRSSTIASASEKGDRLGWQRVPEDAAWRRSFESFNAGSKVQAVGWRRGADSKDGHLNVWMSHGKLTSRACSYMAPSAPGFREALVATYGPPQSDDTTGLGKMMSWLQGGVFIAYQTLEPTGSVSITIGESR